MAKKKAVKATKPTKVKKGIIEYCRGELNLLLPMYYLIHDAIVGEPAVKGLIGSGINTFAAQNNGGGTPFTFTNVVLSRAARYLPQPNAEDKSETNLERYRAYVTRAVFYPVTSRTQEGMAGQIFLRDPITTLPSQLEVLNDDSDGGGLTLNQTAYSLVRNLIAHGRAGLLVDFPVTDGKGVTKADIDSGNIHPNLTVYPPWDIINWRTRKIGSKNVLTFLVLREIIDEEADDGFQLEQSRQYRVLSLDDQGLYVVEMYVEDKDGFSINETFMPTDSTGKRLDYIPFHFAGSENNEAHPNQPPLYALASMNIAHYRNSADYEESCFIVGQPTPVLTGLTEDWVTNVLKGAVTLGSRGAISLPAGGDAKLIQASANTMPFEAMVHKEAQMTAIGAKLVQNLKQTRTATEKIIETTSESSTLINISKNVSLVMVWGLKVAASFVGAVADGIKYELNKDFDLTSMTADDQNAVVGEWQKGAISFPEMRATLRRAGVATMPDDEARTAIQKDIDEGMIPDPAMASGVNVPPGKAASDAGGPQPKPIRRQPKPGSTA